MSSSIIEFANNADIVISFVEIEKIAEPIGPVVPRPLPPVSDKVTNTVFTATLTVTLTSEVGTEIRYTINGNDPTKTSALYVDPLTFDDTKTLKAIAVKISTGQVSTISVWQYQRVAPVVNTCKIHMPSTFQNIEQLNMVMPDTFGNYANHNLTILVYSDIPSTIQAAPVP